MSLMAAGGGALLSLLGNAIASGDDVPFAQLLPRGEHLRIR